MLLLSFAPVSSLAQINDELVQAIGQGKTQSIKNLFDRGADPNACGQNLMTPFMIAVEKGNREIVILLLENGVTALIAAVRSKDPFSVKLLLSRGADANAKTKSGETALKIAMRINDVNIGKLLRQAGAK